MVGGVVIEIKPVVAEVTCKIHTVLFIYLMGDIEIDIIKSRFAVFVFIGQEVQQPVGIGSAGTKNKGAPVFCQGAFYIDPAGEQTDTC